MAEETPAADNAKKRERRPLTMLREFVLADFITLGNAAAGTASIFLCLNYLDGDRDPRFLAWAFALLPFALVLDLADGNVARRMKRKSPYGLDLDSLADVVSFGVAPAVLGFTLGLRGAWDALILVYFVSCGISRLARYNVTAEELSAGGDKVKYYQGTPIPTSLALVLVLFIAWRTGAVHEGLWFGALRLGATFHPLALIYALSGTLMISTNLKIPKP